ncbi:MAG: deoxyribose-phosphate aldolase, partial [Clostridia bacterium]|nr:deoxyribose-phosphate aldolase [Clostridia bacterium]
LIAGDHDTVYRDIKGVVGAANGALVKVIIETCYLNEEQIGAVCSLCMKAGADYVKTSTGFGTAGATPEHVRLMRSVVGTNMKIKAAGGIRTYEDALAMIEASADRLGVSASVAILNEAD